MPAEVAERPPALALLAELEQQGALSVIGLHLTDPNLTYDRYEALCVLLGRMHEAVRFAIGDAIILGERLYHEDAHQAIEAMGLSVDARREYVRVAERVPRSIRRKDLSWSHHRAVAALSRRKPSGETVPDYKAQREWLKRAADEQLSHHALRDALRDGTEADHPKVCRCCGRTLDD